MNMTRFFIKYFLRFCYATIVCIYFTDVSFAELQKNWEIVTVDKEAVYFLDRNSIVLSENQVARVWQLTNFRQIQRVPPQSISSQMDYDCENSKKRIFLMHHHSGVMAKGRLRVANTEGQFDWKAIQPNPVDERIFYIICGKEPNVVVANTKNSDLDEVKIDDEVIERESEKADIQ